MLHFIRNCLFQWNFFTVWSNNMRYIKCNALLPFKQASRSLHNAIWHAGFLPSIEKKKGIASCLCVFCFIVFLVDWQESVGFFCCCYCKMSARDLFFVIAHFDSAFSLLLVWGRCSCYSFSLSSSFWFFFHSGLFLFLIGCLACLLCCWVVYTCMFLLRKTDGVFAAAFAEVCVTRVLRWRNSEMRLFLPSLLFHWHDFFWLWMIYIV